MSELNDLSIEERLRRLLSHLWPRQAHFAGRMVRDWIGLATAAPEAVTSLTLIASAAVDPDVIEKLASRLLGPIPDQWRTIAAKLPPGSFRGASPLPLWPWTDVADERAEEVGTAMLELLDRTDARHAARPKLPESAGEVAGITYRIRGTGPALVLMPLFFAPSQWEPLLPKLAERYTTIVVGGPKIGAVRVLEARGRATGYGHMLRSVIDEAHLAPSESVLEVGAGSGAVSRCLARQTRSANRIVGVDVNQYLLEEASALARQDGLSDVIEFREGNAEALPFGNEVFDVCLAVTVIEEVDADRMAAEMVRVTRPGGRVIVIARAMDVPPLMNVALSPTQSKGAGARFRRRRGQARLRRREPLPAYSPRRTRPHHSVAAPDCLLGRRPACCRFPRRRVPAKARAAGSGRMEARAGTGRGGRYVLHDVAASLRGRDEAMMRCLRSSATSELG